MNLHHITDDRLIAIEGELLDSEISANRSDDTIEEQKLHRLRQIVVTEIIRRGLAERAIANR